MLGDTVGPHGAYIGFVDMAGLGQVCYRPANAGKGGGGGEYALVDLARG